MTDITTNHPAVNHPLDIELPRLALRPREAALALGIGQRLLWSKTNAGEIPHIRIGRAVVYPIRELQDWLTNQTTNGQRT